MDSITVFFDVFQSGSVSIVHYSFHLERYFLIIFKSKARFFQNFFEKIKSTEQFVSNSCSMATISFQSYASGSVIFIQFLSFIKIGTIFLQFSKTTAKTKFFCEPIKFFWNDLKNEWMKKKMKEVQFCVSRKVKNSRLSSISSIQRAMNSSLASLGAKDENFTHSFSFQR